MGLKRASSSALRARLAVDALLYFPDLAYARLLEYAHVLDRSADGAFGRFLPPLSISETAFYAEVRGPRRLGAGEIKKGRMSASPHFSRVNNLSL